MSIYQFDDNFNLIYKRKNDNSCQVCKTCSSCISNICSCVYLPVRLCMGLTWIGSCSFFFYLGTLYNTEKEKLLNITLNYHR